MTLKCIECGGSGVVRQYLNVAGAYVKWHCSHCNGTGLKEYDHPNLEPPPAVIVQRPERWNWFGQGD